MNKTLKCKVLPLSLCILLSACAVPGGHIAHRAIDKNVLSSSGEELSDKVNVFAINQIPLKADEERRPIATNDELQKQINNYEYYVGPGDVLNITVWDHPELTIPAGSQRSAEEAGNIIHNDGTLFYPYVGKISVVGKTAGEIRDLLISRLSKYIENPQIDVRVAAFRSQRVYVTGEVKQPGNFPITNVPLTLVDALNQAGGISQMADWENVVLTRGGREEIISIQQLYQEGDISKNRLLYPNDIIHVNRNDAAKVFVLGEVGRPQTLRIERNGMSLAEALATSGGFNELTADASGIFVLRRAQETNKVADVYQLNASDATALLLADAFTLEPRDIIYVTAAPVARWNRVLSQIMPTVQALYYTGLAKDRLVDND
ncbi:polysaccharide export protein [Gayadomonas joobiniege]|uniref:polysaccharide export protein n=1 Tax=Gayadomonas joobiniege TaxID=1234606 RepID=UPI000474DB2B|nr:polysaccharide export protein [Gayadomonas joobiniege]